MLARALAVTVTLSAAAPLWSPHAATRAARQRPQEWLRSESRRFEIHYQPALAPDLDRVVRSAEAAYDRISRRLNFVLATKVPLVVFAPSGSMTPEQVADSSTSDEVAPARPHRSRIVLPLPESNADLDTKITHELTHLLMCEIILPGQ